MPPTRDVFLSTATRLPARSILSNDSIPPGFAICGLSVEHRDGREACQIRSLKSRGFTRTRGPDRANLGRATQKPGPRMCTMNTKWDLTHIFSRFLGITESDFWPSLHGAP